jgi:branched-chain amino acid transport system permease protein
MAEAILKNTAAPRPGAWTSKKIAAVVGLLLAVVVVPIVLQGFIELSFFVRVFAIAAIYVILALGLNIVTGYAGLLNFGHAAFYAMGAYSSVIVGNLAIDAIAKIGNVGLRDFLTGSTWIAMLPVAAVVAALAGLALGTPVLRLRGDYLAIVTLGFGEIVRLLAVNDFLGLTKGAMGLSTTQVNPVGLTWLQDNARLNIGSFQFMFSVNLYWYFAAVAIIVFTIFVIRRIDDSRLGRSWVAMREDEVAAESVGVNVMTAKLWAFALGAMFGGLAGVIFANSQGFVSPESFIFMESVLIVAMVVLGGMGSIPGVIVGALLLAGIPEIISGVAQSPLLSGLISAETASAISSYRYLAFGALMVIMMARRPQGMIPSKRRAQELRPDDMRIVEDEDQSAWGVEHTSTHDL